MRIYTRTGDDGTTSLFGGQRLSKDDLRIEAYGTLDELNVCIGALATQEVVSQSGDAAFLTTIQSDVFSWGSHLATVDPKMAAHLPTIPAERVAEMEAWMDAKNEALPALSQFILPVGHPAVIAAHQCRVICRRGERRVIALGRNEDIPDGLIAYLNRLSDLFFVWSRHLHLATNTPETPWSTSS